ncbi:MAG: response regulator transcription factor [Chloroflexi bacterium]|nr:response regulator transcription factor [Chloroflexota bacterium]
MITSSKTALKVLVVDDSQEHVDLLKMILERAGMQVISANSGLEALRATFNHHPDAILLDIMMPGMDGFTTSQRLRELSDTPILIVSAKSQTDDITRAFELGADDYVVKPYDSRELLARLHACIRRVPTTTEDDGQMTLSNGDLVIDPSRHRVIVRQQEVKLTKTEFDLLYYFARNRGRVLTHSMILEAVWGQDSCVSKSTLKQFMLSLRKKIEKNPNNPQWLVNEHGVGYALMFD